MFEKMTDSDVMIYLRNTMLALSQLAQERQISIRLHTDIDGYGNVRAGDYDATHFPEDKKIVYKYEPIGEESSRVDEWIYDITPQSIRFGQAPKEEKHGE